MCRRLKLIVLFIFAFCLWSSGACESSDGMGGRSKYNDETGVPGDTDEDTTATESGDAGDIPTDETGSDSVTGSDSSPDLDTGSGSDSDSDSESDSDSDSEQTLCEDWDEDGWCAVFDCDDKKGEIHPNATEIPDNSLDDDCDGATDENDQDTDSGDEDCFEHIDIVFVLDVSTSMSYILATLREEIGIVWDEVLKLDDDPHFGLVVFVDDYLVAKSGSTYNSAAELQADFKTWYTHTSSNQQTQSTATNYDWPENSIDALYGAATEFAWRDKATALHLVIHATDDTFLERPATFASNIQVSHTYLEAVTALQQDHVRVASFAAHLGGPTGKVDVEPGFFKGYNGAASIPVSTSGKVFDIDEVGSTISLADAINGFVLEERCDPYVN